MHACKQREKAKPLCNFFGACTFSRCKLISPNAWFMRWQLTIFRLLLFLIASIPFIFIFNSCLQDPIMNPFYTTAKLTRRRCCTFTQIECGPRGKNALLRTLHYSSLNFNDTSVNQEKTWHDMLIILVSKS
jgi:hypothetical protein